MAKLRSSLSSRRPAEATAEAGVRRAAVALIFRAGRDGSPELLFIKRAEYPGDPWSGQIAFPGGREESGDASLQQTAIRETREETGIDLGREGMLIGVLDDLRPRTVRLPAVVVRPYVAVLDRSEALELSAEVALAFWIPFGDLADKGVVAARHRIRARSADQCARVSSRRSRDLGNDRADSGAAARAALSC